MHIQATHPHVHSQLLGAVRSQLARDTTLAGLLGSSDHPSRLSVSVLETRPWASATFNGARHHLEMALQDSNGTDDSRLLSATDVTTDRIIQALQDSDLSLLGHALIDFQFSGAETSINASGSICRLRFDALTLCDED